jgi:uncharacterized membrane protein YdjX (TVP38/TMEM64 family)
MTNSEGMANEARAPPPVDGRTGLLAGKLGWRRFFGLRRAILLLLFGATIAWAWHLRQQGELDPVLLQHYIDDRPIASVAVFVALYAVSVATMIPTLPFNLAAGVFWGPLGGGIIAAIGAWTGALASFGVARTLVGQRLTRGVGPAMIRWLQQELARLSWRFIAFLRLNPVIPTGPLNYMLGVTEISFWDYCWATLVFLLPPSIAVAWIGSAVGAFVVDAQVAAALRVVLLVSAAVTLLVGARWVGRYFGARR